MKNDRLPHSFHIKLFLFFGDIKTECNPNQFVKQTDDKELFELEV